MKSHWKDPEWDNNDTGVLNGGSLNTGLTVYVDNIYSLQTAHKAL